MKRTPAGPRPLSEPRAASAKGQAAEGGRPVAACLHVTPETGNLVLTLRDAGAEISFDASNPSSTRDDVAVAPKLKSLGVRIDALSADQQRYLASWSEGA